MKKVLVTGGGGFLGLHLCELLVKEGYDVYSFSRNQHTQLKEMGATQIQGDLSIAENVFSALKNMEVVFHVASLAGVWGSYEKYFRVNVLGTQNIIEGCKKHNINYLIYTSTPSVAYQPGGVSGANESIGYSPKFSSHYAETKAIAEKMVIKSTTSNLKTVCLRPHLIWGPRDHHFLPRIIKRAKEGKLKLVGDGNSLVDHIYVKNAALAHLLSYKKLALDPLKVSGKAYFLSQDEPIKIKDFINFIFLQTANINPVHKKIPFCVAYFIGALLELVYKIFNIQSEPLMTRFVAEQLATPHYFDINAAKNDFGYYVKFSTENGVKELKDYLNL